MKKRSLTLAGHRTSLALEPEFWQALEEIAGNGKISLAALVSRIDQNRNDGASLSSSVRVYVLRHFRQRAGATSPQPLTDPEDPRADPD